MTKPKGITFADTQKDLPGSEFAERLKHLRIARLFAANSNDQSQQPGQTHAIPREVQEPSMIEQERPFPAPRPSPALAADVDAAAFEARMEMERQRVQARVTKLKPTLTTGDQTMSDDTNTPRRPEETLREGPLKAAIWRNDGENGAYHSVTVARTYKDRDGNLQDTQSFRPKDMLGLSELARQAHHTAQDRDRELFKERRQSEQAQAKTRGRGHSR